ncbi:multiple epidermal growth factor-like domains protein 8 isoform X3 [Halichoeres trimaculatus]
MASPLPVSAILVVLLLAGSPVCRAGDCKGHRQVLRGPPGYVTDGPGNYSVNGNCEWLIKAPNNSHRIVLHFTFMDTECTHDYLFVYDGDSYQSPLLASLSGNTLPQPIEAKSGKMLLHLFSDADYNLLGFNATYTFSLCPGACGGHGRCDPSTLKCHCHQGWGGAACTTPLCSQACAVNGQCDEKGERCQCNPGFLGHSCQLSFHDDSGAGQWWRVSEENPYTPPRTGSAGVYLSSAGAMYLFGGFDLNRALGDLIKYNFTSNQWDSRSYGHSPVARHSHTAVEWMGNMVLFGGELADGSLANDVWMYRPLHDDWQQLGFSNSHGAPKLANHAAAVVDNYLYVFGGRTEEDMFSSSLYRFGLHGSGRWETVKPTGGKPPATAGHSMVFHSPSRTLLVYGGHHPTTARFSVRVNNSDVFHVDRRFWTSFHSGFPATGPRERAFHTATVIGNYMVVYGGNVHIHYQEEKCYDEEIFFYHLGCHQWVSGGERWSLRGDTVRGRYSHVAAVMEGRVLLVAGGYSGVARGDLVAYKVPLFVSSDQGDRDAVCAEALDESMCLKNPECSWCEGRCREYQFTNPCGSPGCLGLAHFLSDCQSCLVFSGTPASLARAPGEFGWCVQTESCLPVSDRSACRVDQISGAYGWWGERTLFLTSLHSCRTENYVPGLHLLTFQHPRNDSQPDKVTILRSTTIILSPTTEMDVALQFRGFIHPLWGAPPTDTVSMWARIQRLHFEARMATGPNSSQLEVVGRWAAQQENELKLLSRSDGSKLFSNLTRGNHYLVQAEGYLNNSGSGQTSEMALIWNRTLPGGSEISFLFLEPYRSGSCSGYMSCLACLADQSCGWCPSLSRCLLRDSPDLEPCPEVEKEEGQRHLLLAPQHCTLCEEYRDCSACTQDPYCEWQINSSKKGDYQCSRRGKLDGSIRDPRGCPKVCNQRKTCGECLSNSSQCAWCESAQTCFYFAAYLTKYPYGECRDWYNSWAGSDCSVSRDSNNLVWETLLDTQLTVTQAHRFLHRMGHTLVSGPQGYLWMYGGLSLAEGILGNVYRYSVAEHRWTQMQTSSVEEGSTPDARYHHAAALLTSHESDSGGLAASHSFMLVVGGVTQNGVAMDTWSLNLSSLVWREHKNSLLPPVAGHTLTVRRDSSVLLIGGYSPDNGFNHHLMEFSPHTGNWTIAPHTGTPPTGLYGHSAVYHEQTDAIYVFGGYRFHMETVKPSGELYSLYYPNLTWSLLVPSQGNKPLSRFFHAAALIKDTMVIIGGRTEAEDYSNSVSLYQINCNTWIQPVSAVGDPVNRSVSLAMTSWEGRLFLSGGFNGVTLGRLLTLSVPSDPCALMQTPEACNATTGSCLWCRGTCASSDTAERMGCFTGQFLCSPTPRQPDQCRRLKTCSECLARHPKTFSTSSQPALQCKWCTNCPVGACISSSVSCTSEHDCRIYQREIFLSSNCTETSCEASDCPKCTASGKCMWTRQFKRTGETRRILSVNPTYDWTCFSYALLNVSPMQVESSPPMPCPPPCHSLHNCSLCLGSRGSDGGWQHCVWSMALQQCMSPSFMPLRCEAGQCGRLLSGEDSCSPQCSQLTQCSQCIARPQCGWCAARGGNGAGRCLQGGLDGVSEGVCPLRNSSWSFLHCPEEDECANGHHHCNSTQDCHDLSQGYHCTCKHGYILSSVSGQCEPVCAQGCVNGTCMSPGVCRCHFGFVGDNCSSQCSCNKHSNCAGVSKPDVCLECHNNTIGKHCEKCKPLFVGSAKGGGTCRPCRDFCRGNSGVCLSRDEHKKALENPRLFPLDPSTIQDWVSEGPTEENAVCVNCQNNSVGDKCESCLSGYFLLQGKCEKCQCNGHADTCNEHDGTGCPCQNNTETSSCLSSPHSDRKDCYRQQCAKCKDSFNGTPVNGRQCYRQFNVDTECCFDPTSQTNCFHDPTIRNLPKGRTVFFAAQPKFTNVDIRVTIDVTFGEVEVYVSNSHDTFIVDVDRFTGIHTIKIEEESATRGTTTGTEKDSAPSPIKVFANSSSSLGGPVLSHNPLQLQAKAPGAEREIREERAEGLITYITVWKPQTVLIVRAVRDRVVITFPHEVHSLKSSRFYIALRGVGTDVKQGESQGLLFLRQDQAHIEDMMV